MQLVIPMSGIGKRFLDAGYKVPKPLILVSGKPIIEHVVGMFQGIEEILFIVNSDHLANEKFKLKQTLMQIAPGAEIVAIAPHKKGPAWAIQEASKYINPNTPVIVNYCDFAWSWDFDGFRRELDSGIDGLIATYSGFHPHMLRNSQYAYLKLDEMGYVREVQEKTSFTDEPMLEPASSGTYGFKSGKILLDAISAQIDANHSYKEEFYSSLTYKNMIEKNLKIRDFKIERFLQWGTPEDLTDFLFQRDFFQFKSKVNVNTTTINRVEILAAGAGMRFTEVGYVVPKPFLPTADNFLVLTALNAIGQSIPKRQVLLQNSFNMPVKFGFLCESNDIRIQTIDGLTSGQAASALIALETSWSNNCVVATCDSLLYPKEADYNHLIKGKTLGVWVVKPTIYAERNASQFGWVELGAANNINQVLVKRAPNGEGDWRVITGTFIFGDSTEAVSLLTDFLQTGDKVNGEYYLDSLLTFAIGKHWTVLGLEPKWFVSLGTPDEYETFRYWESFFIENPEYLAID